jgi:hypothetical protein
MNSLSPQSLILDDESVEDSEAGSYRQQKNKKPKIFSKKQSFLVNAG